MKKLFLKIVTLFVLFAMAGETTSALWNSNDSVVVMSEKDDESSSKKADTEKEDCKDKLFQYESALQSINDGQVLFVLQHTHFKYSAYLSLPENPPEQA